MQAPVSFENAIKDSEQYKKRHLILGNGFSIACFPDIFNYQSLYQNTNFEKLEKVRKLFESIGTKDFELVIRYLDNAVKALSIYGDNSHDNLISKMEEDTREVKNILASTIADSHPEVPREIEDRKFYVCRKFLSLFLNESNGGHIYTLNYDLLLYWALMKNDENSEKNSFLAYIKDGFGDNRGGMNNYVTWYGELNAYSPNIHFLHGALHLFDGGHEMKKYIWNERETLLEQIKKSIDKRLFPLFVAEGSSEMKLEKIRHNAYLYQGLKQLSSNATQKKVCFFIHGHSLDDSDDHILSKLYHGRFAKLYVSIFGNIDDEKNKKIVQKAKKMQRLRNDKFPLEISFYQATTANVWRDSDEQ